jgi:putative acetyltransferase
MVRPARPGDIEAVHRIYTDASVVPYLSYDVMGLDAFHAVFDDLLKSGLQVAERDGAIAGFYRFVRFTGRQSHVAHLGPIAVHPAWQGRGVARELLDHCLASLEAQGVRRLELLAEADNPRGLAFYRKMGFAEEGLQRRAYRRAGEGRDIDEIMMVRFLDI